MLNREVFAERITALGIVEFSEGAFEKAGYLFKRVVHSIVYRGGDRTQEEVTDVVQNGDNEAANHPTFQMALRICLSVRGLPPPGRKAFVRNIQRFQLFPS